MRIVIVGCGRTGAQVAATLAQEGHEVGVVDRDAAAFARLGPHFRGRQVTGLGIDRGALVEAGVERADGLAALTREDNTNVVVVMAARTFFHVPLVVARIADPQRAALYRHFGIPTISPTTWGANEVRELLLHRRRATRLALGNADVRLVEVRVPPRLVGHSVVHLTAAARFHVVAVLRRGRAFIPTGGAQLEENDLLYIAVEAGSTGKLEELVQP